MKTAEKIQRKIITVDAENKSLGRLAVEVAVLLRGKNKPSFVPYKDVGDTVLVKNIDKMKPLKYPTWFPSEKCFIRLDTWCRKWINFLSHAYP